LVSAKTTALLALQGALSSRGPGLATVGMLVALAALTIAACNKDKKDAGDVAAEAVEHVRNALIFLKIRLNGWKPLSKVLHFEETTIINCGNGKRTSTASMAFRIARLVQVPIDDLLAGKFPDPDVCPRCGYRDIRDANGKRTHR
jgi:hypothetical protein